VIPYGRHSIDEEDIRAVVEVLRSDWLTTGPMVEKFENAVAEYVGARHAVAVSSGTAALHAAVYAAGIGPGDEVIVPPLTFVATANAVVFQGGRPVFADVNSDTLLIDPAQVEAKITPRTKAIIAVDYAGHPCDYDALKRISLRHGLTLIADACHSLGASYKGRNVGTLADLTAFSFHPVKHITTGEGGMVVTDQAELAEPMRRFRNHGINLDHRQRAEKGVCFYEMADLGYNYRLTDFQCALGMSQLGKLSQGILCRTKIAERYDREILKDLLIKSLKVSSDVLPAYHLYVIRLDLNRLRLDRSEIVFLLRKEGIGANVHYPPVHLHRFYQKRFGTQEGMCPKAEDAYHEILSLPIHPHMTSPQIQKTVDALHTTLKTAAK
jgi:perosamine synthetase